MAFGTGLDHPERVMPPEGRQETVELVQIDNGEDNDDTGRFKDD